MIFYIIAGVIIGLVLLYFLFISATFRATICRAEKFPDIFSDDFAKMYRLKEKELADVRRGAEFIRSSPSEEVFIKSHDGLRLHGLLISADNAKATVILFHGFRSFAEFEFSSIAEKYHKRGYNLLLVTQRAHGKSEGKYITFGLEERYDCVSWADYIAGRFPSLPIVIEGVRRRFSWQVTLK